MWALATLAVISALIYYFEPFVFTPLVDGRSQGVATGDGKHVVRWIGSDKKYHIHSSNAEPLPLESTDPAIQKKIRDDYYILDLIPNLFGYAFVGIRGIHSLYEYDLDRNKGTDYTKDDGTIGRKIEHKTDKSKHVRTQEGYYIPVNGVEAAGNIRIDFLLFVTVLMTDNNKSIVALSGKWFNHLSAAVESAVRDWAGLKTMEQIRTSQNESNSDFLKYILKLVTSTDGNLGLDDVKGVRITTVNLISFELSGGGSKQVQDALTAVMVAKETGSAKIEAAEKAAKVLEISTTAEAEARKRLGNADAEVTKAKAVATKELVEAIHSHPEGVEVFKAQAQENGLKHLSQFKGASLNLGGSDPYRLQQQLPSLGGRIEEDEEYEDEEEQHVEPPAQPGAAPATPPAASPVKKNRKKRRGKGKPRE